MYCGINVSEVSYFITSYLDRTSLTFCLFLQNKRDATSSETKTYVCHRQPTVVNEVWRTCTITSLFCSDIAKGIICIIRCLSFSGEKESTDSKRHAGLFLSTVR